VLTISRGVIMPIGTVNLPASDAVQQQRCTETQ